MWVLERTCTVWRLSRNLLISPLKSRNRPGQVPGTSDVLRLTGTCGGIEMLFTRSVLRCCYVRGQPGNRAVPEHLRGEAICQGLLRRPGEISRNGLLRLTGSPQCTTWPSAGVLAISEDLDPVDEHIFDSDGVLLRLLKRGNIRDCLRVENDNIGEHTLLQKAAMVQLKIGRGKSRQSPNGFCERDDFLLADIFTQEACKVAIGSRVRG